MLDLGSHSHSESLVKEPKVFAHQLQQLKKSEAICVYQEKAWRAQAIPYFETYPEYQGVNKTLDQKNRVSDPYSIKEKLINENFSD